MDEAASLSDWEVDDDGDSSNFESEPRPVRRPFYINTEVIIR